MVEKIFPSYSRENESKILDLWHKQGIIGKIIERNKKGKDFFFLQGPPYTSGKIHCGQAWNHSLKDAVLRYKRMTGHNVLARAGYDMHGLPTEHKVQAALGLEGKDDIESFGEEKFVKECLKWSEEKSADMTVDLQKLGVTLDFSDPYKPIQQDYIDSVWYLIKEADKKERLYLGEKTMSWCASCATAVAKHEQEYKEIKDTSIFLKFKKVNTDNEYFIVWTTTPWTIPFNLAIMVNPEMEYVDCKVTTSEGKEEVWTVCKDLAGIFLGNVDDIEFEIGKAYLGEVLEGKKYIHPWAKDNPDISEIDSEKLFSVLLSKEYVDSSAGTGLVHCAPGCGPEDYEVGVRNGIPPYNAIDEKGYFPERIPKYAGLRAKFNDKDFIKLMEEDGFLIKKTPIEHDYAHCERCHNPVVFRKTKQWFFKVEDLKERMLEFNKNVNWHPQTAKNAFNSWLENLRDNSITKQRIFGTPAPIWVKLDEEGEVEEYYVVSSKEELEKVVIGELPENLHKPWIDDVKIKHPETGTVLSRIPDVLDVWIDAGCASWASLYFPKTKEEFERYFPADYIVEGKDQIRGWFNLLMVAGILAFDKPVFKNVGMHGFIAGVDGVKMSKSLGNIITPAEVVEKSSVDTFRYYFTSIKGGEDIAFSWDELNLRHRHMSVLWNVSKYLMDLIDASELSLDELLIKGKDLIETEEKYILSLTNHTIRDVTAAFENYKVDDVPSLVGELFLAISRNYIQAVRDKCNDDSKSPAVVYALYESLIATLKVFSPVAPFITEEIFQNLKQYKSFEEESVHEFTWPEADKNLMNVELESQFNNSMNVISGILAAREKAALNVRQPVGKVVVVTKDVAVKLSENLLSMIKSQANVKAVDFVEDFDKLEYSVKANFRNLSGDFGAETAEVGTAINQLPKSESLKMHELFSEGKTYDLNGKEIKNIHVDFNISVSEPFVMSEISKAVIALDKTLTEDLINEGLSRELTRRIQNARKDLGLVKTDRVEAIIDNQDLFDKVKPFVENICNTCGISGFQVAKNSGEEIKFKGIELKLEVKKV